MARKKLGRVTRNEVAIVAYRLTRGEGVTLEEATVDHPLVYLHGKGQIERVLEDAFEGREVGATFEVEVPPEGLTAPTKENVERVLPRDALPLEMTPKIGAKIAVQIDDDPIDVWITGLGPNHVQVGLTPPFDDEALKLKGEILKVRAPTADELKAGEATAIAADGAAASTESE